MSQSIIIFLSGQALGLLGVGIGAYLKIMTRLKEFEIRIVHVEKQDDSIQRKLDEIYDALTSIKIELANKQNRD